MHKALSVRQPFAWAILAPPIECLGDVTLPKTIENRTWGTDYRGPLWIHAAKPHGQLGTVEIGAAIDNLEDHLGLAAEFIEDQLVYGAILGVVDLVICRPRERLQVAPEKRAWAGGPWCWVLARPRRLIEPIPYRGRQGLLGIPERILAGAQLERRCRLCGCTDEVGCAEGCWWVTDNQCSAHG